MLLVFGSHSMVKMSEKIENLKAENAQLEAEKLALSECIVELKRGAVDRGIFDLERELRIEELAAKEILSRRLHRGVSEFYKAMIGSRDEHGELPFTSEMNTLKSWADCELRAAIGTFKRKFQPEFMQTKESLSKEKAGREKAEADVRDLSAKLETLKSEVKGAKEALEKKELDLNSSETKRAKTRTKYKDLKGLLESKELDLNSSEKERAKTRTEYEALKGQNARLLKLLESKEGEFDTLSDELKTTKDELETLRCEHTAVIINRKRMRPNIDALVKHHDARLQINTNLLAENAKLKNQLVASK